MATIKIKGMRCAHCVASVTEALNKLDGIDEVTVSLEKGEASYRENKPVTKETVKAAIAAIGFEVAD